MYPEHRSVENRQSSAIRPIQPSGTIQQGVPLSARLLRCLLLGLSLALPCSLFAQQSGTINGQVTDATGGAIPNALITLIDTAQGTAFKATTNSAGEYSVPAG